jgi:hypothetical protein
VWTSVISTVNGLGVGEGQSSGRGPGWELVLRCGLRVRIHEGEEKNAQLICGCFRPRFTLSILRQDCGGAL